EAAKIQAAPIRYRLESLAASQKALAPDTSFTSSLAVKDPVVLVPEDAERATGDAAKKWWTIPPVGQYGAPNDGKPSGPGTTRLADLVTECYEHLRCLKNPSGRTYLAPSATQKPSWFENVQRIYLTGHSGGGKPLVEAAGAAMVLITSTSAPRPKGQA